MFSKLDGKKTYAVALGGVLGAIGGWLTGQLDPVQALQIAFNAVAAATIRHGIAKSGPAG